MADIKKIQAKATEYDKIHSYILFFYIKIHIKKFPRD